MLIIGTDWTAANWKLQLKLSSVPAVRYRAVLSEEIRNTCGQDSYCIVTSYSFC